MNKWEADTPHGPACAQRVIGAAECTCGKADALADPFYSKAAGAWIDLNESVCSTARPEFYACGICGHCHPIAWDGDCRDDANRFTNAALDDLYSAEGWVEVEMPT